MKKLLPADYLAEGRQTEDVQVEPMFDKKKRSVFKRTMEFNGVQVSLPQYLRLMELQEKVLKLDQVMRRLSDGVDPEKLAASAKWGQLVSMRQSLQKLLPENHPTFSKRAATMDFNGVQVSFQYLELKGLWFFFLDYGSISWYGAQNFKKVRQFFLRYNQNSLN